MSTPTSQLKSLYERVEEFFLHDLPTVEGFQPRPTQREMAILVARGIEEESRLTIEAGTGTGKSLAYLVPLLLRDDASEGPAVIATKTVQLQDQLLSKDLPRLQNLLEVPRKVVQAKGWSNYVCIRRVETPDETAQREVGAALPELRALLVQRSGRLTRQESPLSQRQWELVKADPSDCQKRNCPHFGGCGLFAERRELESAEVIVTNHAFLLTDLKLRRDGKGLLPEGRVLVLDEAHRLDDTATEHLAVRFDPDRIHSCVGAPLSSRNDGWLAATRFTMLMTLPEIDFLPWAERFDRDVLLALKDIDLLAADLFLEISYLYPEGDGVRHDLAALLHSEHGETLANLVSQMGLSLEESADGMARMCREYEEQFEQNAPPELVRLAQTLARLGQDVEFLSRCESEDWVYQVERDQTALVARPVDNADSLREELYDQFRTVVATSASLRVNNSFEFFLRRTGLAEESVQHAFPSPFEVHNQTFVGLVDEGPEPASSEYPNHLCGPLSRLIGAMEGRSLLLTTSHRRVQEYARLLEAPLMEAGVKLLVQGRESPGRLLKRFASGDRHALLGVDTFWEGVDIPGERLSCVIMTRLPFPVPVDVLFQARARRVEREGGHSFRDLSMPLAGLKLKQGFGRLLRSESDRGIFLLTDPRGCCKRYGRELLRNLPLEHAEKGDLESLVEGALEWWERNIPHHGGLL